jgi:hypothetical protein
VPEPTGIVLGTRVGESLATAANSLLPRLLGPALDEIGGILGDRAKIWRAERQLKLLTKADRLLREANLDAQRVPLKALVPILDGVVLEEDDEMIAAWAALLANAAAEPFNAKPVYAAVLREMTPLDAFVFTHILRTTADSEGSDVVQERHESHVFWELQSLFEIDALRLSIDNLIRLNLVTRHRIGDEIVSDLNGGFELMYGMDVLGASSLGRAFFRACSPPAVTPDQHTSDTTEVFLSIRDSLMALSEFVDDSRTDDRMLKLDGVGYELHLLRPQLQRAAGAFGTWEAAFGPWRLTVRRYEGRETSEFEWPGLEVGDLRELSEADCHNAVRHARQLNPRL